MDRADSSVSIVLHLLTEAFSLFEQFDAAEGDMGMKSLEIHIPPDVLQIDGFFAQKRIGRSGVKEARRPAKTAQYRQRYLLFQKRYTAHSLYRIVQLSRRHLTQKLPSQVQIFPFDPLAGQKWAKLFLELIIIV